MRYYEKVKQREKFKEVAEFIIWAFGMVTMIFFFVWVFPIMLGY
jgi:hypothetical protein